jgi:hypothetical protein
MVNQLQPPVNLVKPPEEMTLGEFMASISIDWPHEVLEVLSRRAPVRSRDIDLFDETDPPTD